MGPQRINEPLSLALITLTSLGSLASASYDCRDIITEGVKFNLEKLDGQFIAHWSRDDLEAEARYNYNFTLDICHVLKRHKGAKKEESCSQGTRVCAIEEMIPLSGTNNATIIPIDIAGTYALGGNGKPLDPKFELLSSSKDGAQIEQGGLRVELHGGQHELKEIKKKINQRAVIDFVCDPNREGTEGDEKDIGDFEPESGDSNGERKLGPRDDGEVGKCEDSEASLRFCGYELEKVDKNDVKTLRLEWRTKYACKDVHSGPTQPARWGFFTWFIIILFLAIASYLIFGSWLNYNRYGARGWDLLPHGDTIRDIPYVLKDVARNVVTTVQGSGSRGGYSAV